MQKLLDEKFLKKLKTLSLVTKKYLVSRGEGRKLSSRRGGSIEFSDHRKYSPGDEYRYVDWSIYGRSGKLFVKEFSREEELLVHFIIDQSLSMSAGEPQKLFFAKQLAAALSFVALSTGNRVKTAYFHDNSLAVSRAFTGPKMIYRVLETLQEAEPSGATRIGRTIDAFLKTSREKGLVVLLSDLLDEEEPMGKVAELASRGYDAAVIHVLSHSELNPSVKGEVELFDMETGKTRRMFVTESELAAYRKEMQDFIDRWRKFCLNHKIRYYQAVAEEDVEAFVVKFLRKGGLLKS